MARKQDSLLGMTGMQLRAFMAVAEFGGFSSAANKLGVSQPTVSKAVTSLERKLGPLFERSRGRTVKLNPVGILLKEEVANIIQLLREIERKIEQAKDRKPLIRIAIGEYLFNRCKGLVSQYVMSHPTLTVQLEVVSLRDEAFRALRLGNVDIVFVSHFGEVTAAPRVTSSATMKLYCSPNIENPSRARLLIPILEEQRRLEFCDALADFNLKGLNNHLVIPNYFEVKSMCLSGKGMAFLFEEDAHEEVEKGLLTEAMPGSIQVNRDCFYCGESETLQDIAAFLINNVDAACAKIA